MTNWNASEINEQGPPTKPLPEDDPRKINGDLGVVATLIATITYSAGINPLGGVHQEGTLIGTAVASGTTAFKVFSVFNNLALSMALTGVFLSVVLTRKAKDLAELGKLLMLTALLSMAAVYVAAVAAVMEPAPPKKGLDWTTVFLLCLLGYAVLAGLNYFFAIFLIRREPEHCLSKQLEPILRQLGLV